MIKLSSGAIGALIWDTGIRSLFWRGTIEIYSSTRPSIPDEPPGGTPIARITESGLTFEPGVDNGAGLRTREKTLVSLQDEGNWTLTGLDNGTPRWWRWKWFFEDDDSLSLFYPRIDGDVGESLIGLPAAIDNTTSIENIVFNYYMLNS